VLAAVYADRSPVWTQLALDNGYFDQSHLIRDFLTFSGLSPAEYLRRLQELHTQGLHVKFNHPHSPGSFNFFQYNQVLAPLVSGKEGNEMSRRILILLIFSIIALPLVGNAQGKEQRDMTTVRVRYMVKDLDPAVQFYTHYLGFQIKQQAPPNFAMLSRGNLELVLSTPYGPGGAAQPMPDGRKAEPGGWNRIIINVDDLTAEVARLRKAQLHFRNDIVQGPGGSEIMSPRDVFPGTERKVQGPIHMGRQVISTRIGISFLIGTVRKEGRSILKSEQVAGTIPVIRT
jgi:catechol 2,3-dioxygenase-like lactoylglutathione lyase family enzyme